MSCGIKAGRCTVADKSQGVTTGRPYAVENEQHKTIVTDQYVVAAHGKAEKDWPYIACSESPFTDVSQTPSWKRKIQSKQ